MLDSRREVIWKWFVGNGEDILDQPVVNSDGTIIGIALDGIVFALDLNGKERWRQQMNGAANYAQIEPYSDGKYLLLIDMSGYRLRGGVSTKDRLSLCKGNEVLKSKEFPHNAKLKVGGGRIFAVVREEGKIKTKEIRFE
jgi:hypothetical protein